MDSITLWLNTAGKHAITPIQTTELLARLARTTDEKKRQRLINRICEGNLKLVYFTVKAYSDKRGFRWGSERSLDLLQVGFEGLSHAVGRYDAKKGTKLSTIAVPWIKQKVGRYIVKCEQPIYTPENLVQEVYYFWKHGKLSNSRTTPKNEQLVHIAAAAMSPQLSLDKPLNEGEEGGVLVDTIAQPDTSNRGAKYDLKFLELKDLMAKAGLPPRIQDYVLIYAETGVKSSAFVKAGLDSRKGSPSQQMAKAIDKLRALV